jgi:hypothetical protein
LYPVSEEKAKGRTLFLGRYDQIDPPESWVFWSDVTILKSDFDLR